MTAPLFPDPRLQTVASALRSGEAAWRALGVTRLRVFGSVARGEAWGGSDIDLLVDFAPGQEAGLLDLMRVKALCEDLLDRRVDVLTEAALKAPLRGEILADAVDVTAVTGELPVTHRPKRWRWRVYDLLDALDRLQEDTAGLSLTTFLRDERTRDAVLRNLARLGETTKFIPQSVQDRTPGIPWAYLRDVRNLISHDYFGIDPELVWHTLRRELPPLRPLLQALAEGRLLPGPDRMPEARTVMAQVQTPPVEVVGTRPDQVQAPRVQAPRVQAPRVQAPQVQDSAERERQ